MKKKTGKQNMLYPMPVTIIGAVVNGKINFINVGHVGIFNAFEPNVISVALAKTHYTNQGIREHQAFSVNIFSQDRIAEADYIGLKSGFEEDKSSLFRTFRGDLEHAPLIEDCPISMECRVIDTYPMKTHDVFIGEIAGTYVDESVMTDGQIDLAKVKPILFDMHGMKYWSLGQPIGDCWEIGKNFKPKS